MKKPLIVGNWKSNKTIKETEDWFLDLSLQNHNTEIALCPPFPLLYLCKTLIKRHNLDIKLGAQTVSQFGFGKHTGEINASLLKDFVEFVLIGHSERRNEENETDLMLFEQYRRVKEVGLTPIYFVQNEETPIPDGVEIIAYEPVFAIGTGNPDNPEDVEKVAKYFKYFKKVKTILYGGSVDDKNISLFLSIDTIDGVVPGGASLDPKVFSNLINNA